MSKIWSFFVRSIEKFTILSTTIHKLDENRHGFNFHRQLYKFTISRIEIATLFGQKPSLIYKVSNLNVKIFFQPSALELLFISSFSVYNVLFVVARLSASILSIFVFWFGLKSSNVSNVNLEEGNFNTGVIRMAVLSSILVFQVWMMWNFILFQFKKLRENSKTSSVSPVKPASKMQTRKRNYLVVFE